MAQLEDGLHIHDRTDADAFQLGPFRNVTLRPEGKDVPSGVADVIPEFSGWNQEMHHSVGCHRSIFNGPLVELVS